VAAATKGVCKKQRDRCGAFSFLKVDMSETLTTGTHLKKVIKSVNDFGAFQKRKSTTPVPLL